MKEKLTENQLKIEENHKKSHAKEKLLKQTQDEETRKRLAANKLFEEANKKLKNAILGNNI